MSDRQLIAGAARRLLAFCDALTEAHQVHGLPAGSLTDLSGVDFQRAAKPIYELTLSPEYLEMIGTAFGGIAGLMGAFETTIEDVPSEWAHVRRYFSCTANQLAPSWTTKLIRDPDLVAATTPTPAVMRFDLLAGMVTTEAALEMAAAARTAIAIVSTSTQRVIDLRVDDLPSHLLG